MYSWPCKSELVPTTTGDFICRNVGECNTAAAEHKAEHRAEHRAEHKAEHRADHESAASGNI